MNKILLTAAMLLMFPVGARAYSAHEWQDKIGTDKLAHFGLGAACSYTLTDRVFTSNAQKAFVFTSKRYRKAKALVVCSTLAFLKEQRDTAFDHKDFEWTLAGISIPLITWKW